MDQKKQVKHNRMYVVCQKQYDVIWKHTIKSSMQVKKYNQGIV